MRLLALLFVLLMAAPALPRAAAPTDTVHAMIADAPEGATIVIPPGTYHVERLPIKAGQTLIAHGVTFTGGVVLADWTISGDYKYAEVDGLINSSAYADKCEPSAPRCHQPNTLWHDDEHLSHVARLQDVTTADRYYIDYAASRVWVRNDAQGTLVLNVMQSLVDTGTGGWSIVGATIQHYASKFQRGAVFSNGPGVTLDRVTVRRISGTGVKLSTGATIVDSRIERALQLGLGTGLQHETMEPGISIRRTVFAANGFGGVMCNWEGGAMKLVRTLGAVFENNHVVDNCIGSWWDIDNDAATIRYNLIEGSTYHGLFWEISARALIECNVLQYNGTAYSYSGFGGTQLHISNGGPVQARRNLIRIADTGNAVHVYHTERGSGLYPWTSTDNWIEGNTIVLQEARGSIGIGVELGHDPQLAEYTRNLYDGNTYYAPPGYALFRRRAGGIEQTYTFSEWQGLGQDRIGTMLQAPPDIAQEQNPITLENWPESACGDVRGAPTPTTTPTAVPASTPTPTPVLHPLYRLRIIIEVDGR